MSTTKLDVIKTLYNTYNLYTTYRDWNLYNTFRECITIYRDGITTYKGHVGTMITYRGHVGTTHKGHVGIQVHAQYNVVIRDMAQTVVGFMSTTKLDVIKTLYNTYNLYTTYRVWNLYNTYRECITIYYIQRRYN